MSETHTISASWLAPVSAPPIRDGFVTFRDGKIEFWGPNDGRPIDERFDDAILLPGLVNAHTHLDLTGTAGKTPPRPEFCEWLKSVIEYRRSVSTQQTQSDIRAGIRLLLDSGTTLVGDITSQGASAELVNDSPLRSTLFLELIGLTQDRMQEALLSAGLWSQTCAQARPRVLASWSPHAPYSFRLEGVKQLPGFGPAIAMHVAESTEEIALLNYRRGPMVEFLQTLDAWDPSGLPANLGEAVAQFNRGAHPIFVHGNYLAPETEFSPQATVVYCPRTHAAFGHPPHPFRHWLARGIRVVFGTDSLASNPDLSVLNEARFVAERHSELDPETLLHMITDWPADAIGHGRASGAFGLGKSADFCVVTLPPRTKEPLRTLFNEATPVCAVYAAGQRIV